MRKLDSSCFSLIEEPLCPAVLEVEEVTAWRVHLVRCMGLKVFLGAATANEPDLDHAQYDPLSPKTPFSEGSSLTL